MTVVPEELKSSPTPAPSSTPTSALIESEIVLSAPKNLQKQARLLMYRVKENPEMGWNERGELTVHGQVVAGSNIVDLIGDMMRRRKNVNPVGWQIFTDKLVDINVPKDLIRNPDRINYIINKSQHTPPRRLSGRVVSSGIRNVAGNYLFPEGGEEEEEEEEEGVSYHSQSPYISPTKPGYYDSPIHGIENWDTWD